MIIQVKAFQQYQDQMKCSLMMAIIIISDIIATTTIAVGFTITSMYF